MKAEGVDDWLKHWFRLQQKKKYPLILKDPSEAQSDDPTQSLKRSKGTEKGKAVRTRKGKEKALPESSEDEDSDQNVGDENEYVNNDKPDSGNGENTPASGSGSGNVPQDESKLPPAPSSAGKSKKSRIAFLKSLSEDRNYRQLIKLLHAAKVSIFFSDNPDQVLMHVDSVGTFDWHAWTSLGQLALQGSFPAKGLSSG